MNCVYELHLKSKIRSVNDIKIRKPNINPKILNSIIIIYPKLTKKGNIALKT